MSHHSDHMLWWSARAKPFFLDELGWCYSCAVRPNIVGRYNVTMSTCCVQMLALSRRTFTLSGTLSSLVIDLPLMYLRQLSVQCSLSPDSILGRTAALAIDAYCYRRRINLAVMQSVCLPVCLSQSSAMQKRLNQWSCRLRFGVRWAQEKKCTMMGSRSPMWRAILRGKLVA